MEPQQPLEALNEAVRYLSVSQNQNGSWNGPIESRLFETALAGYALVKSAPIKGVFEYIERNSGNGLDTKNRYVKRYKLDYETLFENLAIGLFKHDKSALQKIAGVAENRLRNESNEEVARKLTALSAVLVNEGCLNWSDMPEVQITRLKHFILNRDPARFKRWRI